MKISDEAIYSGGDKALPSTRENLGRISECCSISTPSLNNVVYFGVSSNDVVAAVLIRTSEPLHGTRNLRLRRPEGDDRLLNFRQFEAVFTRYSEQTVDNVCSVVAK